MFKKKKKDIVFGKLNQAVFYSKSVLKQTDDLANLCLVTRLENSPIKCCIIK